MALANFDGTALHEHADPRPRRTPRLNTLIFNYGRNEVRQFSDQQCAVLVA
jgi:1,4-alpha-glucan branching enzyme